MARSFKDHFSIAASGFEYLNRQKGNQRETKPLTLLEQMQAFGSPKEKEVAKRTIEKENIAKETARIRREIYGPSN
jgi:hypothetical protein